MSVNEEAKNITSSLEDYLEAIYKAKIKYEQARVKDIAKSMNVKMPSVSEAIRTLADKGLVVHKPYSSIELTAEGLEKAREISHRHSAVRMFLADFLGLDEESAENEACGMEHTINSETLERLRSFVDFFVKQNSSASEILEKAKEYIEEKSQEAKDSSKIKYHKDDEMSSTITSTKMSDLTPGMKGRVAFVSGKGPIRKRLLEMGITKDERFEVIRVAPFGDPIEIKIKNYLLSIRKKEAELVEVEVE
ncbi:MAG: FeoA domain-containing protein [Armatimonadota bacterium]